MKKSILIAILLVGHLSLFSQNTADYLLEIKDGYDLGTVQKTVNPNGTLTISTDITDFSNFLNSKSIYSWEKAFPTSTRPKLQRVYLISLDENTNTVDFNNRAEVEIMFMDEEVAYTNSLTQSIYPNDYDDFILGGRNTALDLMKVPLAWTITTGDPSQLVGLADSKYDLTHPEMIGQMIDNIIIQNSFYPHGTAVAGTIAAVTDNNVGIPGIAYDSKLIGATCGNSGSRLIRGLIELSQYPGVRVINCSWVVCADNPIKLFLDEAIAEVDANNVLVVAAAGQGPASTNGSCDPGGHGYAYPASYDSTISVTSVGQRYPIDYHHPYTYWSKSWKDVHEFRPHNSNTDSHTHNDKVDVSAPGHLTINITDNYVAFPDGYYIGTSASQTTPHVTAVAALVFAANPNLTPAQVKDILRDTADDIYHIPYNWPYIGQLGTGRVNAYRAVLEAQCMLNPSEGLDLAMQNSPLDTFSEPDNETVHLWSSKDIWVRNQNDGFVIKEHENPVYLGTNPNNYVYVNVTNNSCETSSGNDNLKLYWSKANTSLKWPGHWNGTLFVEDPSNGNQVLIGDEIGTVSIPILEPGESKVLEFTWTVPNPQDYVNINSNPWHFCLLARIESDDDPMTFPEIGGIVQNVKGNNNIVWKNMSVIEISPTEEADAIGAVIAVGNPFNVANSFDLEFSVDENETGSPIYYEAEVTIEMDDILYDAWVRGGKLSQDIDSTLVANKKIIVNDNALLQNIQFNPNEFGTAYVYFNFLTDELTNKEEFIYHVIQKYTLDNEVLGGETYVLRKATGPVFDADAGSDEEIDKNESVTLTASDINQAAIYNWYDPDGNLIYTGTDLTVAPNITQTYKLEIISDLNGLKDYDEVEITVNPYYIESLTPNPASNSVNVEYMADEASSAYVMIINTNTGTSDNYILDPLLTEISIDISAYPTGLYSVSLVCDGSIEDSDLLIVE